MAEKMTENIYAEDVAIIIPSRIGSTRLPEKPLEMIGSQTMIEHVVDGVRASGHSNIYVATDNPIIAEKAINRGVKAIMTAEDCPTGTDRAYQAFCKLPACDKIKYVVNVQGDMPFIDGKTIAKVIDKLHNSDFDVVTPVVRVGKEIASKEDNVCVVIDNNDKALYFSRSLVPSGAEEFLYHIGIYGYKAKSLARFVGLSQTDYEKAERLEQLRALQNGLSIGVCYADDVPISVDTATDLQLAREYFATKVSKIT